MTIINVCIFVILTAGQSPVYVVNRLDWKYFPDRNKTLLVMLPTDNRDIVENVCYLINNVILNFSAFVVIIVCTIALSIQLHNKTKWRLTSTTDTSISRQNTTAAKLVLVVSIIFIICFIPNCVIFVMMSFFPDYSVKGKNFNVLIMVAGAGSVLESINSSVNICVYYRMSTNYRNVFNKMFTNKTK